MIEERLEALKAKQRKAFALFRFQTSLLENPISIDKFQECLLYLTPQQYSQVVEERALSKNCGFPLCTNPVGDWSTWSRRKVSVMDKIIYEKDEVKHFCAISCYNKSAKITAKLPLHTLSLETAPVHPIVKEKENLIEPLLPKVREQSVIESEGCAIDSVDHDFGVQGKLRTSFQPKRTTRLIAIT